MCAYDFRPVIEADLPLIGRWRATPHVRKWWGEPTVEDERKKLTDRRISMWIVRFDGQPIAFAQDYDVHDWSPHPFSHLPPGSRGIDQYIGEADMIDRGHGSAFVKQHIGRLFADGAPAVGTDPHPSNIRARRAYEKAGFVVTSNPVDTPWGRAVLMECWQAR